MCAVILCTKNTHKEKVTSICSYHASSLLFTVSEDKNAEKFAVAGGVHVVISSSALKRITDNHPPNFEKAWDLPVIVKEYKQCGKIF